MLGASGKHFSKGAGPGQGCGLKSEDRRPKPEFREWPELTGGCSAGVAINSDLGLRVSGLEWPGPTLEPPWGQDASLLAVAEMRDLRKLGACKSGQRAV